MQILKKLPAEAYLSSKGLQPAPASDAFGPCNIVDGPRVTVTGHRTDSFGGFNGLMFQAMFEMPFGAGLRGDENHDHEQPIGPDDPLPSLPVSPELVVQSSEFFQNLTAEAQQAVMASPTLVNQLATFFYLVAVLSSNRLLTGCEESFSKHGAKRVRLSG